MTIAQDDVPTMRTVTVAQCRLCGSTGVTPMAEQPDRLFGAPGRWGFRQCPDPACGLWWLDPQPVAEDLPLAYRTYYTHQAPGGAARQECMEEAYLARRHGVPPGPDGIPPRCHRLSLLLFLLPHRRMVFDFPYRQLRGRPPGRLLEVGCGNGRLLTLLQRWGWEVAGVDFDGNAVEHARQRGMAVRQGDLASQNYADASFDVVLTHHVLEHLPDPEATLREVFRILRPGGLALMVTPNAASLGRRVFGMHWRGWEPPRHLHLFNPVSARRLARQCDLPEPEVTTQARGCTGMFLQSWSLARFDRLAQPGLVARLLMEGLAWAEVLLVALGARGWGEELHLAFRKPGAD